MIFNKRPCFLAPSISGLLVLLTAALTPSGVSSEEVRLWIGTTTPNSGGSRGIYTATLDSETGKLSAPILAGEIQSPGFLTFHPKLEVLYSVCQRAEGGGGVAAWRPAPKTGKLELIGTQPIGDGGAAHLATDAAGKFLFTAQYGAGTVAMFPLDSDGEILPRCDVQKHEGSGPNQARQKSAHPHWVGVGPGDQYLYVPDLGIDQVVIYRIDRDNQQLKRVGEAACPAGGGPRHMKFHPRFPRAYVLNELTLAVTTFALDASSGMLSSLETVPTLDESLKEIPNKASEIRIHPTGKFVYAANRGHDSIAVFEVKPDGNGLKFVELEAIRGSWPRNFNLDPTGKWLLAAGRNSNTISVFSVDESSGRLTFTGQVVQCPTPICIEFAR